MRNTATCLVLVPMSIGSPGAARAANPVLKSCLVVAKKEVQVPAKQSGVLVRMIAERGMQVPATQKDRRGTIVKFLLARIDDADARAAERVAWTQLLVAHEEASSTVNERFYKKSAEVAKAELDKAVEANRRLAGTISGTEVRRLVLAAERAVLQIEQSEMDRTIAGHTESVRKEEYQAAQLNVEKRTIRAPFAGFVEDIYRQEGEWVREGDPVMRLIRLDELLVEGFVNAAKFNPSEIAGRKVKVTVKFARGETRTFPGKISFVSANIQAGGNYRVSAEVPNKPDENGVYWLLPGARAEMTILLD